MTCPVIDYFPHNTIRPSHLFLPYTGFLVPRERDNGACIRRDATETTHSTWPGIILRRTDVSNAPPINQEADRIKCVYVSEREYTPKGPECLKAICVTCYC